MGTEHDDEKAERPREFVMKKKLFLVLVILLAAGTAAFAQFQYYNGWEFGVQYLRRGSAEELRTESNRSVQALRRTIPNIRPVAKLPNSVLQVVNHALEDYRVNEGDIFRILVTQRGNHVYDVYLRITSIHDGSFEFYAYEAWE